MYRNTLIIIGFILFNCSATSTSSSYISLGRRSSILNDATSDASCIEGYVAQKCRCKDPKGCDGSSFVEDNLCRVWNNPADLRGSQAEVICVPEREDNKKYVYVKPPRTKRPTATCPAGSTLVNCALLDYHSQINDPEPTVIGQSCLAPEGVCRQPESCIMQIRCKVDYCGDPGDVLNTTKTGEYYVNDTVTYSCDDANINHTIKCYPKYGWNASLPSCPIITTETTSTTEEADAVISNTLYTSPSTTTGNFQQNRVPLQNPSFSRLSDRILSDGKIFWVVSGLGVVAAFSGFVVMVIMVKKHQRQNNGSGAIAAVLE